MLRRMVTFVLAVLSLAVVVSVAPEGAQAEPQRKQRTKVKQVAKPQPDPFVGGRAFASGGNSGSASGSMTGWGTSNVVAEARRWIGTNPTKRRGLWCARFMNFVLQRSGYQGTGSDLARSFARYGRRVSEPQVGAIAVMSRGRRGGHVGIVSGIDANGNPIIISGNHNNRVAESTYPRGRIRAYVMPRS